MSFQLVVLFCNVFFIVLLTNNCKNIFARNSSRQKKTELWKISFLQLMLAY